MHRQSAEEFLLALLQTLNADSRGSTRIDLPPDFERRFMEVVKKDDADRSQAIRQLFEDFAGA
jgi:hypothetical protein